VPVDPLLLFFLVGVIARLAGSDLRLPAALVETITLLLLLSIGLKGGVELRAQPVHELWLPLAAVLGLGVLSTVLAFLVARYAVALARVDAAAISAHYGSVSIGTFAVAVALYADRGIRYEPFLPLFVVLLEIPGIVVGVALARGGTPSWSTAREIFTGKSLVALLGGVVIGAIAGRAGIAPVAPLFIDGFKPALSLFLLEMGIVCASRLPELRSYGIRLAVFAVIVPLANGIIGALLAVAIGLSVGGTAALATLAASASYIAAPAAIGQALPGVNPALSLAPALGVTFPFNVTLGIPLYLALARWLHS
jgi:uncharacterized protein